MASVLLLFSTALNSCQRSDGFDSAWQDYFFWSCVLPACFLDFEWKEFRRMNLRVLLFR